MPENAHLVRLNGTINIAASRDRTREAAIIVTKVWGLLQHDGLVLRYERLHDDPTDEVGHGTDAEDDHIGGRLALEPEEGEAGTLGGCPVEELTRAEVDAHGADTAGHRAEADDGADGRLREHIADGREEVSRPGLVPSTEQTDEDSRPPCTVGTEGLCKESENGQTGEDEHGAHTA